MQLNVVSDTICPWCYVGKKRLDKALEKFDRTPVEVMWRPFQLDPSVPKEGIDRKTYIKNKFGDGDYPKEMLKALEEAGHEEGIAFDFSKITVTPNTMDSHRLIRWASSAGCQDDVVTRLFQAYFEKGDDIGNQEVLTSIAEAAGMNAPLVAELLSDGRDIDLVQKEIGMVGPMGITGVPTFIAGPGLALVGAQEVDAIVDLLNRTAAEEAVKPKR